MTTSMQPDQPDAHMAEPLTLSELLRFRAERTPDAPLFRCGGERRTAREMETAVARMAGTLQRHGVRQGTKVALMSANRTELLDLILGCSWLGAVAVPINTAARGQQLRHILSNSQAELMVTEGEWLQHLSALDDLADLDRVWLLDDVPDQGSTRCAVSRIPENGAAIAAAPVAPGDPAAILYTSGTTGVSKGVVCPQGQFFWWGKNVSRQLELTSNDVLYTCLPLFHTNALNAFSQALVSGAEYVLGSRFSASRFWDQVTEVGATFTYLLGAMVSILVRREPSSQDRAHTVKAALAPATPAGLLDTFRERFGVVLIDGYGSTETNAAISASRSCQRSGYMGWLQEGFEARTVDDRGVPVPAGTPGELLLRSSQPLAFASGYYRMPDATVEAWRDLWFHTGDRVVLEADGWVRFVDRIKDVIRRRGENISSVEVEQVISEHPAVSNVAVYAVDSELGEDEVMAAVVPNAEVELDLADLVRFCQPRLAYFAIPRFFMVRDALPLTENGKVRKAVLREWGAARADWDREGSCALKDATRS